MDKKLSHTPHTIEEILAFWSTVTAFQFFLEIQVLHQIQNDFYFTYSYFHTLVGDTLNLFLHRSKSNIDSLGRFTGVKILFYRMEEAIGRSRSVH